MRGKRIISVLLLFLLSSMPLSVQATNPIQNPGFEEGTSQDIYFWSKHAWGDNPGVADFALDEQIRHSDQKSARIVNNALTDARLRQEIKAEPNTHYRISCWIKTENVGSGAKGANISADGVLETSKDIKETHDWEQVELYGRTGKTQSSFILTLGLGGYGSTNTGKAWFDDVTVEALSKAPEGKTVVNLDPSSTQAGANDSKKSSSTVFILFFLVITCVAAGLLFVWKKNPKPSTERANAGQNSINSTKGPTKFIVDKRDMAIMGAMTLVYLVIALFNLGSLKVPQTAWEPAKPGESFTLDFSREIDISRIYYYGGLGDGKVRVEYADPSGRFTPLVTIEKKDIFSWKYVSAPAKTQKLRFIADVSGSAFNELAVVETGKERPVQDFKIIDINSEPTNVDKIGNLFDEQAYFAYRPSYMTGMYFDEIYHARTAFEHIHKLQPFEWTHPPLGKIIIAIGIQIFGMNPFGWRVMGTLFGAAMVPLMYLFGKKLFDKRFYGFCAAFLMMFDFMHFAQTRIATIDVYGTFFIILMYYYMYDYFVHKSYDVGFTRSLKPLFLSGLFFGLGAASKWIAIYGGAGLALLFFLAKAMEYKDYSLYLKNPRLQKPHWLDRFIPLYMTGTLLCCVLFFVIIPAIIYYASYIPYMLVPGAKSGLSLVLDYQSQMYGYHSKLVATHSFSSPWYEWPIIYKPTWFYSGSDPLPGKASTIVTMGNPAIWWIGIFAVVMALIIAVNKRDRKMGVVFTAMVFQYIPWVLVSRITWIYHFFSTVPFMILSIVYVIKNFLDSYQNPKNQSTVRARYVVYAYLGVVALLFFWFYPALSGLEVSKGYIDNLKWFKSWIF